MSAYRSPVVGAAGGLFAFYWGAAFLYWLWTNDWYLNDNWAWPSIGQGKAIIGGCAIGIAMAGLTAVVGRKIALLKVQGDAVSGVSISMGAMPMPPAPPTLDGELDLDKLRLPEGVGRWHVSWLPSMRKLQESGEQKGKVYVDLVVAILKVLAAHEQVPAGIAIKRKSETIPGGDDDGDVERENREKSKPVGLATRLGLSLRGRRAEAAEVAVEKGKVEPHGGHTLLEHSYTVASMAMEIAKTWTFDDAVTQWNRSERFRKTFRKIGKKNGSYVFRRSDELVPIIALAHDLGKIKTFKQKDDGSWTTVREDHDSLSAQMLMRIPEFWKLPRRERRITLLVVSTYHRDAELRRHIEHVGYEDRIFALLQLLIVADKAAGMLEEGRSTEGDSEGTEGDEDEDWKPKVWEAFSKLINQANRIAPKQNQYRIGQKNIVDKGVPMIILNEMAVRKELERMLPKECLRYAQTRVGSDINGLTGLLLETLDRNGVLVKQYGSHVTAPTSAIWQVDFYGRDKEKQGSKLATWKYAILVDPTDKFPNLCEMPNADSVPRIDGPTGNRNEGLGYGDPKPETGIDEAWEFEGDDGNLPHDDDEKPAPPPGIMPSQQERADSSVFSRSTLDIALPEAAEEAKASIEAAKGGKKRTPSKADYRRAQREEARNKVEGGQSAVNEFEDRATSTQAGGTSSAARETKEAAGTPTDEEFMNMMMELASEAASGRVIGVEVLEEGAAFLIPYKQATKARGGRALTQGEVMQKVSAKAYRGVSLVPRDDGVFLRLQVSDGKGQ